MGEEAKRMSCRKCFFYKRFNGFCKWNRRSVKRYVDVRKYSCIGYVNKKDDTIRGKLYHI